MAVARCGLQAQFNRTHNDADNDDERNRAHTPTNKDTCWSFEPLPFLGTYPNKIKYVPPCGHLNVPSTVRISCIADDNGRRYVMGPTERKGAWGKLKLLLPIDNTMEKLCVKEGRLSSDQTPIQGRKSTAASHLENIEREFYFSRHYGGPFAARHLFTWRQRSFLIFPLAADNLAHFALGLDTSQRAVVAREVALRGGQALARMHREGCVHLDVSNSNFLIQNREPYVVLADFGSAERVSEWGISHGSGLKSTYSAPETFHDDEPMSDLVDVWALGAVVLSLLHPTRQLMPSFLTYSPNASGGVDETATKAKLQTFFDAAQGTFNANTLPIMSYINACKAVDHPLTDWVVKVALVPVSERWPAEWFVEGQAAFAPLPHAQDFQAALRAIMGRAEDIYAQTPNYRALQAVRANAHQTSHLLPSPMPAP